MDQKKTIAAIENASGAAACGRYAAQPCSVIALARKCANAYRKYEAADALFSSAMAERYGEAFELPDELVEDVRYGACASSRINLKRFDEIMTANGYPPNSVGEGREQSERTSPPTCSHS